ncbi:MAG: phosphoglycerate mutase family protein [Oscillospiraceae bacterium]|jgi:probable phosphoglycerate mutase|nr:phosphoglycerate mutase family protein [Oscillospiraceae bacterium]
MRIITVQHTQAEHHLNGMVGGSSDWPLTALGHQHARSIAGALRKELGERPGYALYSSDMIRTTQTANAIAEALQLPIVPVPELRELKMGSATGKSRAWMKENQSPRAPGELFLDYRPLPDAESWREMRRRVAVFAERLESDGRDAIVVAHGGSLAAFTQIFMRVAEDDGEYVWCAGRAGCVHRLEIVQEPGRAIHVMRKFNEILF